MQLVSERDDVVLGGCSLSPDSPREVCSRCEWPNSGGWTELDGPDCGEFSSFHRPLGKALEEFHETQNLNRLALSFDAYAAFGSERVGPLANEAAETWAKDRRLPKDIMSLRICLFFEQRRSHHTDMQLDRPYTRALLARLEQYFSDRHDETGVPVLES